MSVSTTLGILSGIAMLVAAIMLGAEAYEVFINVPGIFIVLGGTIAATLISFPLKDVLKVFSSFFIVFRRQPPQLDKHIQQIVSFMRKLREGTLALEKEIERIKNPFLRDGIQMLVDGYSDEDIREMLESRIYNREQREQGEANVFFTMASFAPAFGMIGTLIGLIKLLVNMSGSGLEEMGPNMAVALVTTFYGLLLANLIFKPIGVKLEKRKEETNLLMTMITDSVIMMQKEWHPVKVEDYLNAYVAPGKRRIPKRGSSKDIK